MPPRCNARIFWAGVCPCSQGIGSGMRAMRIWRLETPHVGALIRAFCDAESDTGKSKRVIQPLCRTSNRNALV